MPEPAKVPAGWTMPVTAIPISGESWRSFLRRSATLNDTTVGKLVDASALVDDDVLNPAQRRAAARLVGLDEDAIRAMTLNAWAGTAFPFQPYPTRNHQGPSWTWLGPTFHCNACLKDGLELLEWRLPWITACATHETYLTCGGRAEPALPEDLDLDALHRRSLRSGRPDGHFDIWRDAVRLAIGLRRCPRTRSNAPAPTRAHLFAVAEQLARADSAQARTCVLAEWCGAAGVRVIWDHVRQQLRSRIMIDAADALEVRVWIKRRALAGVAG